MSDGSGTRITSTGNATGSAVFSPNGKYRYHLRRSLGASTRVATFIMLNPSTADAERDDPTIRKCLGFCRRWGCGELHVVNLFAFRASDPARIRTARAPIGPDNFRWISHAVERTTREIHPGHRGPVVCAWGVHGSYLRQGEAILGWIEDICQAVCLGLTRDGHPRHPLYVPYSTELIPLSTRAHPSLPKGATS